MRTSYLAFATLAACAATPPRSSSPLAYAIGRASVGPNAPVTPAEIADDVAYLDVALAPHPTAGSK